MEKWFTEKLNKMQLQKFETYFDMLIETNAKFNLTAITEESEVYEKHFFDSFIGEKHIPQNASLCDVGSGAGFPAIPLKIVRDDIKITMVDSLNKRVGFLRDVANELKLDAEVFHSRAEDFAKTHREKFDVVTARAVASLPTLLEYTAPLAKVGGLVLCYKTDESESSIAKNAEKMLGLKLKSTDTYNLPNGDKRCFIIYEKISTTPNKFPRGQNKPRTTPLN